MRQLPLKALFVLDEIRESGETTCKALAERVHEAMPSNCVGCEGSGKASDGQRCRRCHGRGKPWFSYSECYQALRQLQERGLVLRRNARNEFGDATNQILWFAAPQERVAEVEALERAFAAPSSDVSLDA